MADGFLGFKPNTLLLQGLLAKPTPGEAFWRQKLANQGSISRAKPSLAGQLENAAVGALRKAGVSDKRAARLGSKTFAAVNDFTPLGNATMAADAGQSFKAGHPLQGLGLGALAVLPGAAGKMGKGMFGGGIRAWHGSPHDFDKFSLAKIGTGEGAQAYGHGLYFAENRDVAEGYKAALTQRHAKTKFDGKELAEPRDWWKVQDELEAAGKWRERKALDLADSWKRQGYDLEATGNHLRNEYRNQPEMIAAIDDILPKVEVVRPKGAIYEVNINAKPKDFLDWDRFAEDQADLSDKLLPNYVGQTGQLYQDFANTLGSFPGDPAGRTRVAEEAWKRGIPGVRYLDQGSRIAGQGSRNYVVFDDSIIDILNKY